MAIFKKGINGAFSGTIGSTVGASWRHIHYMRSLPKPSKKPASPQQLAQRARFALAVSFLQPMKWLVNLGFNDRQRGRSTGYNRALQLFITQAITGDYPDYGIDFSKVTVSQGNMDKLVGLSVASDAPNTLSLAWTDLSEGAVDPGEVKGSYDDDRVYVLLYNRTEQLFTTNRSALRGSEGLQLELPPVFAGHEFHAWAFVRHRDGMRQSTSQYAGTVVLAGEPDPGP
ncbi:hypothetical protein SAMN05421747_1065 [Parapedobacter composti]|uniref:Uncharacterized protein n=1 Tax=Parapedobacter composti TaxID=623281 RepID=A0A1I1H5I0_9SPHI|nr:DUF6266 family protein [Parapedobacter composti]SFC19026.1 hypothetical protein SAMN05421747_1065 [Parapedobacter composti]